MRRISWLENLHDSVVRTDKTRSKWIVEAVVTVTASR